MERSNETTDYIIIRAETSSHLDKVDFAIVHITEEFTAHLQRCLSAVQLFQNDAIFHNMAYWYSPLGYFSNAKHQLFTELILNPDENWAFIKICLNELTQFSSPLNLMEGHQLIISSHGHANFKACCKNSLEEYWTDSFSIPEILKNKSNRLNPSQIN